uniref:(northern house mosquito) hypothetical protein n=1 Tax=Culex pipiens TaxID=7175 RepID=A0A8D8DW66_CULPI
MLASHCSMAVFLLLFELASEMVDITNANSATLRNSTNLLFKIKSLIPCIVIFKSNISLTKKTLPTILPDIHLTMATLGLTCNGFGVSCSNYRYSMAALSPAQSR